jgi:hypothetical protein
MEPSGYASAAATSSRRGVSGPTLSSSRTRLRIREYPLSVSICLAGSALGSTPAQGPRNLIRPPSPCHVLLAECGGRAGHGGYREASKPASVGLEWQVWLDEKSSCLMPSHAFSAGHQAVTSSMSPNGRRVIRLPLTIHGIGHLRLANRTPHCRSSCEALRAEPSAVFA